MVAVEEGRRREMEMVEEETKAGAGESGEIESEAVAEAATAGRKSVRTLVPEVEIHVYRQGKGPVDVSKWRLGGWDQDQLEVRDILDRYGFKSIHAFNPNDVSGSGSGRGAPIRFNPRNGRSLLPYKDGAVVCVDGDPKDSLLKPITKILLSVAVITLLIALVAKEPPAWIQKMNIAGGIFNPWIIVCMVIVFTRMRKRTKDFLKKYGW